MVLSYLDIHGINGSYYFLATGTASHSLSDLKLGMESEGRWLESQ